MKYRLILSLGVAIVMGLGTCSSVSAALVLKTPKMEAYRDIRLPEDKPTDLAVLLTRSQLIPYSVPLLMTTVEPASVTVAAVEGAVLNYPNPFRISEGTEIGYKLTKDMDLELHIFDMLGHRIFKKDIKAGEIGGTSGYNLVPFGQTDIGGFRLPAAVYFYYLIHNGKVLGKGKMVVRP